MPIHTADAIILRTYKLGETDRIVVFLTRDRGKKRGVARHARQARSAFGGALEPLTHVRVGYFERERRELVSLNHIEVVQSVMRAPAALSLSYAEYFAELADEFAAENNADERLFRLLAALTPALGTIGDPGTVARYVEYWMLRLQGVYPPASVCRACGRELVESGGALAEHDKAFLCGGCTVERRLVLGPPAFQFLAAASRTGPADLGTVDLGAAANIQLEAVHRNLITRHLEKEPKSMRVLRLLHAEPEPRSAVPPLDH